LKNTYKRHVGYAVSLINSMSTGTEFTMQSYTLSFVFTMFIVNKAWWKLHLLIYLLIHLFIYLFTSSLSHS